MDKADLENKDNWDGKILGVCPPVIVPLFSYVMVGSAELACAYIDVLAGILIHIIFLFSLMIFSSLVYRESIMARPRSLRRAWQIEDMSYMLNSLILLPLIGIIKFSMPVKILEPVYWFIVIGIPLTMAIVLLIRNMKMSLQDVGIVSNFTGIQFFVAISGIPLGFCEYMILKPDALTEELTMVNLIISAIVLLVFSGLLEELVFRGIVQGRAEEVIGKNAGLLFASVLFMLMHIGFKSPSDLIFVFLVGLFYGYVFQRTKNIWGITLSHGISNIFLFMIAPFILS